MRMQVIHLLALPIAISFISCSKDWLNKKPDISTVVPATFSDIQGLLDNFSQMNDYSPAYGEVGSDGHYILDANFLRLPDADRNAYTWSKDVPNLRTFDWLGANRNGTYGRVFSCNLVLETLSKITPQSTLEEIEWNNIKGQALFQRSRSFYELAQIYALPYSPISSTSDLGIPLKIETDINIIATRPTVKSTYDQIISDLLLAKDLLPIVPKFPTRASKPAVYALLARIYLDMEIYDKALSFADSALSYHSSLMNYNDLSINAPNPITRFNEEVIFHSTMANLGAIGAFLLVDIDLYSLYEDNDLRQRVFFGKSTNGITFKGSYNGNFASIRNFNGLATDEQYLIRAECHARAGEKEKAMVDLNTLLKNRWNNNINYIDLTAVDADDALRKILLERRKELLLRGLRWSDLRRLNRDPRFAVTLTRTIGGQTYTLSPESYRYTFPIPDDIIEMTGIQQNPGWE